MSEMERDAVISGCTKYRFLLRRAWDHDKMRALFIMLNPSTADAFADDPTIRSCVRLCTGMGYGSFEVVNLFAWRATDPKDLDRCHDPVGDRNDGIIESAVGRCDTVICAWGAAKIARSRARAVCESVRSMRPAIFCFGATKDGSPKHPLYIKSGTVLETYRS